MYIEKVFQGKTNAWRFVVGIIIVITAVIIAQFPFAIALFTEVGLEGMASLDETQMMRVLDPNTSLFYILLPFAAAFFTIFLVVNKLHNQKTVNFLTARPRFDWKRVFFAFLTVAILAVASLGVESY